MTPTAALVAGLLLAALIIAIVTMRRASRQTHQGGYADLGVVSTRWISELRRDEPWSGS